MAQVRALFIFLISLDLIGCGSVPVNSAPSAETLANVPTRADRDAASYLNLLLDESKLDKSRYDNASDNFKSVILFTTPAGYRLKTRFQELGVPVSQALVFTRDRQLRQKLLDAARWTDRPVTRGEALLALAAEKNPDHLKYFREAMLDRSVNIQFAAVEALSAWGLPTAKDVLMEAATRGATPVTRVYAAQAALRLGDARGRDLLLNFLRDGNWLVRAMAARYIGELGRREDADLLISRIGPEQDKKFVVAELCVAAIRLAGLRAPAPPRPAPPPVSGWKPAARDVFELEPLVITAPRLKTSAPIDPRIDVDLLRLLDEFVDLPPEDRRTYDPLLTDLLNLTTPTGINMKVRYTDLSYLLTEGLAGTKDFIIIQKLENMARNHPQVSVRASALVALGFDPDRRDISVFRDALRGQNVTVRFAAIEGLSHITNLDVRPTLAETAGIDPSSVLRLYAAQALRRLGDPGGREILLRYLDDSDWVLRSMSTYLLGEVGDPDDYYKIVMRLGRERDDFVLAESCLAIYRLAE